MRVEFVDAARDEASAVASHYESEVPGLGFEFLAEVDRGMAAIGEHPSTWLTIGSVRGQAVRRFLLSRFPHGLVYVVVARTTCSSSPWRMAGVVRATGPSACLVADRRWHTNGRQSG